MKNAELRAKLHEVGKRCLALAKSRTTAAGLPSDAVAHLLVEVHACLELVLNVLEDVDDELEARVVVVIARMRSEGKL